MKKYVYEIIVFFNDESDDFIENNNSKEKKAYYDENHFDVIELTNKNIVLKCERSNDRVLSDIIKGFNSTMNKQLTKSLIFFFAINGCLPEIKLVKVRKFENQRKKGEIEYKAEQLIQPFSSSLNEALKIEESKLDVLFCKDLNKSQALMISLSLWLKGVTSKLAGDTFDCFWTSFNSLYSFISNQKTEFNKRKDIRSFILNNRHLFTESSSLFSAYDEKEIRRLRWREMILNDYETEKSTKAFRDFILRYKDYRLNKIFQDTLPYRKEFLSNAGYLNEVEDHIKTNISNKYKDDYELLCFYLVKYSYFLRNKYFHGEKIDSTIYLIKTTEIEELTRINEIFKVFLRELIISNDHY
ncbi:hypothetical protein ACI43K_07570 [Bacillus subtilis]|uniref:hypothetical protein n=1 Tax=Bacillus subtilis TaxID=1423 RepID=UPI0010391250|nr:hypothetical protein [Bacillus subtilis]QBJ82481.1 hypothetical protein DL538_10650 [Bacillus subtilis subsp. subtilis]QHL55645.1 hypothetical protein C7M23_02770 [Bacillus subtilis]UPG79722.1 hypothetical protein MX663_11360 [Bacillus subtilis]BET54928.1 hypothetical protein BsubNA05_20340 [Bacillus subtilis]